MHSGKVHSGRIDQCKNGHIRTSENTRINARGYRECLECIRAYRKRRAKEFNKWDGITPPPKGIRKHKWGDFN